VGWLSAGQSPRRTSGGKAVTKLGRGNLRQHAVWESADTRLQRKVEPLKFPLSVSATDESGVEPPQSKFGADSAKGPHSIFFATSSTLESRCVTWPCAL